ncbi:hypothetical protein EC991_010420 [Linnemannia zychae]|nr:hypothetical protein EC991_010420 [Linnemannia zychae]
MPFIRSDSGAMPTGFGDDDPTVGMGFSILITICSLAGLLFCFRRASTLLPRNLTIPLQMFGQNNNSSSSTRGPIALSDDDMEGATRIDWEELDAQFEDMGNASGTGGSERMLAPVTRQARYLDDDEEADGEAQPFRTSGFEGNDDAPFLDDDEDDVDQALEAEVAPGKPAKSDQLFNLDDEEQQN